MTKDRLLCSTRAEAWTLSRIWRIVAFLSTLQTIVLSAQLKPTQVTFGGQTGELDTKNPPLLLGVKKDGGPLFSDYNTQIVFRNQGADVILKDVAVAGYAGRLTDPIPSNATKLELDTSGSAF